MSIQVTGAPKPHWGRPDFVGPGRQRKVAIIGSHSESIQFAPYRDPSWDIWVHSSTAQLVPKGRADRLFDLHPRHCFEVVRKNGFLDYFQWLKDCRTPVYMQEAFPDIPAAVRYPREMVKSLYPDVPFGSQSAWMIALALCEGVTQLGFWGVHYSHGSDYEESRANCEYWIGIARGTGVQITIAPQSPLCHEPREDYAYETHSTPEKYAARLKVFAESMRGKGGIAPKAIETCTDREALERAAAIRMQDPNWRSAMKGIGAGDEMPAWLLESEAKARSEAGLLPMTPHFNPVDELALR